MDQELVQYLDERFGRIEQRLDGHGGRFDAIEQRLAGHETRFEGFDSRFDNVDERIRHNGVLIEGLREQIQLVAEGLIMHIEVRHREDREYFDRKFEDTHTLLRSFNQRVENLERNRPN